jgi:hypothetical protein
MTRVELRRLFRKHRGQAARLARELERSPTTVSAWFRGHLDSARIEAAVLARAKELIEKDIASAEANARIHRELAEAESASRLVPLQKHADETAA